MPKKIEDSLLIVCPECSGSGEEACCGGHMCPGTTLCGECGGKGKVLSKEGKELKKQLEILRDYR